MEKVLKGMDATKYIISDAIDDLQDLLILAAKAKDEDDAEAVNKGIDRIVDYLVGAADPCTTVIVPVDGTATSAAKIDAVRVEDDTLQAIASDVEREAEGMREFVRGMRIEAEALRDSISFGLDELDDILCELDGVIRTSSAGRSRLDSLRSLDSIRRDVLLYAIDTIHAFKNWPPFPTHTASGE